MKICFVKKTYVTELTGESTFFSTPPAMLENFLHRSLNISFIIYYKADIFVVDDGSYVSDTEKALTENRPDELTVLRNYHKSISISDIPFERYDIVISIDRIIPRDIIEKHPEILWCYYEAEHGFPSFERAARHPEGGYDLFLNHAMGSAFHFSDLPQSVAFPYLIHQKTMQSLVGAKKRSGVFLDNHLVGKHEAHLSHALSRFENICGEKVTHAPVWNFNRSWESIGKREPLSTKTFLNTLAESEYFVLMRGHGAGRIIGQSAIEAAALDLVVISDASEIYSRFVCHPYCIVHTENEDDAFTRIHAIASDEGLKKDILSFQRKNLAFYFWKRPTYFLEKALEVKKRPQKGDTNIKKAGYEWKKLSEIKPEKSCSKKLSIIVVGDNSGGHHRDWFCVEQTLWEENDRLFKKNGVEPEWIYLEWRPVDKKSTASYLAANGVVCAAVHPSVQFQVYGNLNPMFRNAVLINTGISLSKYPWKLVLCHTPKFQEHFIRFVADKELDDGVIYYADFEKQPVIEAIPPISDGRHNKSDNNRYVAMDGSILPVLMLYNQSAKNICFDETLSFYGPVDEKGCYIKQDFTAFAASPFRMEWLGSMPFPTGRRHGFSPEASVYPLCDACFFPAIKQNTETEQNSLVVRGTGVYDDEQVLIFTLKPNFSEKHGFFVNCPHCRSSVFVSSKGAWACPVCGESFVC